eukprot:683638-Pyramimonas_sp.AAC.2
MLIISSTTTTITSWFVSAGSSYSYQLVPHRDPHERESEAQHAPRLAVVDPLAGPQREPSPPVRLPARAVRRLYNSGLRRVLPRNPHDRGQIFTNDIYLHYSHSVNATGTSATWPRSPHRLELPSSSMGSWGHPLTTARRARAGKSFSQAGVPGYLLLLATGRAQHGHMASVTT